MSRSARESKRASDRLLEIGLLILVLWLAFGLRLAYFFRTNRIVDEYISMLAIQAVLDEGVPVLPSGLFYGPKGLLHSYLGALAALVFGPSEFALCFPSMLAGVVAVCYVYRAGRDWFSPTAGLSAAMSLSLLSSAVMWGGRVRMYGLWQTLSVISVYLIITGYVTAPDHRARLGGIVVMLLAVLTHTLALIILGGLVVAVVVCRLISPLGSKQAVSLIPWEILAGIVLVVIIILLDPFGGAWGAQGKLSDVARGALSMQSIQERVPFLLAFTYEFVTWPLWPLTIFYAIGFIRLFLRLVRRSTDPGDWVALSLYVLVLCAWLATSVLSYIQRDRYLFGIIPVYLLLAVREVCVLARTSLAATKLSFFRVGAPGATIVVSLLLVVLMIPSATGTVNQEIDDLGTAYLYVRDVWSPGDVIAACHPAPSQWILGRVDYYVIEQGAEVHDGVDNWTGAPWINSPDKLAVILGNKARVWYVADDLCWERFLGAGFRQLVQQNMTLVFAQSGVRVFVSDQN
jgi:4-amino-4-deoxy-L-arabinose transferase-like glycosyltransferase